MILGRVLQDKTKRNKGSGDGAVIGVSGRKAAGKEGALRFSKNNDRICLNISGPPEGYPGGLGQIRQLKQGRCSNCIF